MLRTRVPDWGCIEDHSIIDLSTAPEKKIDTASLRHGALEALTTDQLLLTLPQYETTSYGQPLIKSILHTLFLCSSSSRVSKAFAHFIQL